MSITNRTVMYDDSTGVARFSDWAIVNTTLGTMVEPFSLSKVGIDMPTVDFDPTDIINRIDRIDRIDIHKELLILSGGDHQLSGGVCTPRTGP